MAYIGTPGFYSNPCVSIPAVKTVGAQEDEKDALAAKEKAEADMKRLKETGGALVNQKISELQSRLERRCDKSLILKPKGPKP